MKLIAVLLIALSTHVVFGQVTQKDSIPVPKDLKFKYTALIIPAVFITYGFVGLENHHVIEVNEEFREEINEHIDDKFTIDDITQYAPLASVYALNAFGIKGNNNFKDRTVILATASLITAVSVRALKHSTISQRPDFSSYNSFPSGHTATAFMGAEFLFQEYKDVSIWYGISGYVVAAGTGFFRMYNNRHWFTDVAAGAGIGILSTKIAYWIHPFIRDKVFKCKSDKNAMLMPFYNGQQAGLGFTMTL